MANNEHNPELGSVAHDILLMYIRSWHCFTGWSISSVWYSYCPSFWSWTEVGFHSFKLFIVLKNIRSWHWLTIQYWVLLSIQDIILSCSLFFHCFEAEQKLAFIALSCSLFWRTSVVDIVLWSSPQWTVVWHCSKAEFSTKY